MSECVYFEVHKCLDLGKEDSARAFQQVRDEGEEEESVIAESWIQ